MRWNIKNHRIVAAEQTGNLLTFRERFDRMSGEPQLSISKRYGYPLFSWFPSATNNHFETSMSIPCCEVPTTSTKSSAACFFWSFTLYTLSPWCQIENHHLMPCTTWQFPTTYQPKVLMVGGMTLCAIADVGTGLASSLPFLIVARLMLGAGLSSSDAGASAWVADATAPCFFWFGWWNKNNDVEKETMNNIRDFQNMMVSGFVFE